jgi:hypothetical protein
MIVAAVKAIRVFHQVGGHVAPGGLFLLVQFLEFFLR